MKKFVIILILICAIQMSAQELQNVVTDYKVALQQLETQDKLILVFVTDGQHKKAVEDLDKDFFGTEAYKNIASKLIVLKLDVSDKSSSNSRLASHYIKQKSGFGLALVDKSNNTIGKPLVDITSKNIQDFISFLNSKL